MSPLDVGGPPVVVAGGSFAGLATAWAAARAGCPVRLVLPERCDDLLGLELGLRVLELEPAPEAGADPPPLAEYRPGVGAHRPWQPLVHAFLAEVAGAALVPAGRLEVFLNGRWNDDWYLTCDLHGLRDALTDAQAHAIASQVRAGDGAGVLRSRASFWRTGGVDLEHLTLAEASRANHGGVFHELAVESVCRKILPGGSAAVLATLRRRVGVPVFWPSTLADAVRGRTLRPAPDRCFRTLRPGGAGAIVAALLARLEASPFVEIVRRPPLRSVTTVGRVVRLEFVDGSSILASDPVLAHRPEELFAAVGADYRPERVRAAVAWAAVAPEHLRHDPSLVTIADADVPAHHVTGADARDGRRILCVELAHDCPAGELAERARATLRQLGVVAALDHVEIVRETAVPSFVAPHAENRQAFLAAADVARDRLPGVRIVGAATVFGGDALSEQIVQALAAVELRRVA